MVDTILIIIYFLTALISIKIGFVIFYHFKKFNFPDNNKAEKILSVFKWGSVFFSFFGIYFSNSYII